MPLEVTLIDYARDPLQKLYGAYRTCYTPKTPGRGLGRDPRRPHPRREDPRVRPGAAQDRPRLPARAGGLLVRDLRRLARALPPVRPPPDRHQLRAAVAALREVQGGAARVRDAEDLGEGPGHGRRVRPAHARDHPRLRGRAREGDPGRGRALRPAQRDAHELPGDGELHRAPPHRRPAALLARAVGDPAHGRAHAARGDEGGAGARRLPPAEVRRQADGLLRRAGEGVGAAARSARSGRTRSSSSTSSGSTGPETSCRSARTTCAPSRTRGTSSGAHAAAIRPGRRRPPHGSPIPAAGAS